MIRIISVLLSKLCFLSKLFTFFPPPGKEEQIYQKLKSAAEQTKTFKVYKREDIPRKYYYSNNSRIGPIFVIAEVGYAFQNLYDVIEYYKQKFNITGNYIVLYTRLLLCSSLPYCF